MNDSGITAQYGFLFQRKALILYALENANTKQLFTFEGKDDIEVSPNDRIYALCDSGSSYIQVKSGNVDESCFAKIIGNWLLLDSSNFDQFKLVLENELSINLCLNEQAQSVYQYIVSGEKKKKSSIARQVFEKYKSTIKDNPDDLIQRIKLIVSSIKKDTCSMQSMDNRIEETFSINYCQDIQEYQIAKSKRLERFAQYMNQSIDIAIKEKKSFRLLYTDLMRLIMQVTEEISDHKYAVSIPELKKKSKTEAEKIVKENKMREVAQLYLVDKQEDFVVDGIVHELIYRDFRDVYIRQQSLEIDNLEQNAKENHDMALFSLDDDTSNPRKCYIKTVEKPIDSTLLPSGPIYRKGCYIYLTGDEIDSNLQISWGGKN